MVKLSRFAKIRENRESFPPRMFCRIRYMLGGMGLYSFYVQDILHQMWMPYLCAVE